MVRRLVRMVSTGGCGAMAVMLLMVLITKITGVSSNLYVEQLIAPNPARSGETIQLTCRWSLPSSTNTSSRSKCGWGFSQVKWWKDGHQLYKIDSNCEKTDYHVPGIHVVLDKSTTNMIVLRDVGRATEGQYICEVMGEGPTFRTTNAKVNLTVAEIPETPVITGARAVYRTGENVNVKCTAEHSRPPSSITFLVNGRVVLPHPGRVTILPPTREVGGAFTTQAVLTLPVTQEHEPMLRLTCRAKVLGISVEDSQNLRIEASAHRLFSIFGAGTPVAATSGLLLTVLLLLLSITTTNGLLTTTRL